MLPRHGDGDASSMPYRALAVIEMHQSSQETKNIATISAEEMCAIQTACTVVYRRSSVDTFPASTPLGARELAQRYLFCIRPDKAQGLPPAFSALCARVYTLGSLPWCYPRAAVFSLHYAIRRQSADLTLASNSARVVVSQRFLRPEIGELRGSCRRYPVGLL